MSALRGLHWFHFRAAIAMLLLSVSMANAALFGRNWNEQQLQLVPDKSRAEGDWRAGVDILKGNRRSGINIEIRENRSTYGFYLPKEMAPRLEGKTSDGSTVHFAISADSGDLQFTGAVKGKVASGRYVFEPDKEFAAEAGKLLKTDLSNDDLLKLAFARISLAFIRGVQESGISPAGLEEVVRLRNHGLDPVGIKAFVAAGFRETDDVIRLRNHGVTPDYATKARALGYGKTAEEVTRLRNHGVNPEYLQGWKDAGFGLTTEEVVRLRNHGVQPEFGAAWRKAGFEFDVEQLIRARNHGVPTDFAVALNAAGTKPSLDEVIRMRNHGVSADYFRQIKAHNPSYTTDDIVRFRQFGVQPEYIRAVSTSRTDFTAEQIVKLRNHGVPAEYVAALNIPDRKPLDADSIIDLRNRGISAETARKLRE